MALTLGAFITITDPEKRADTFQECLAMAQDLCDDVAIIDGKDSWPYDFSWQTISDHFQLGYERLNTDWVLHLDCDFIFHEKDFGRIRQEMELHNKVMGLTFNKRQFILPDRFNVKSRLVLMVNKAKFGDRIKWDGGGEGDRCQPSYNTKYIHPYLVPDTGIPFYNYEKIKKTKAQIAEDSGRMDRAYKGTFGEYQLSSDGSDNSAWQGWLKMSTARFNKPSEKVPLDSHPKYMIETIKNLKPEMWGYNGFGLIEGRVYA